MAEIWIIIGLTALLTFGIRLSFIALSGRWQPPEFVQRALRFVPPAVLSAIILPEMLVDNGDVSFSPANPRMLAGGLAMLIAWRTRNTFLTIVTGMLVLYLTQFLLNAPS